MSTHNQTRRVDRKTFHPYQFEMNQKTLYHLHPGSNIVVLQAPPGAGKTLITRVTTKQLFDLSLIDCALIAAPMEHIERAFISDMTQQIQVDPRTPSSVLTIPTDFMQTARNGSCSIRSTIETFLQNRGTGVKQHGTWSTLAMVCTHAALSAAVDDSVVTDDEDEDEDADPLTRTLLLKLPADCSRMLLVLDEAHHLGRNGLGLFAKIWVERGGLLLLPSATPFRTDGEFAVGMTQSMKYVIRTIAEQMQDGYAPQYLQHACISYADGYSPSELEVFGDTPPPVTYWPDLISKIIDAYISDGLDDILPKANIYIPSTSRDHSMKSAAFIDALMTELRARVPGIRILNGVGTDQEDKDRFLDAMNAERSGYWCNENGDILQYRNGPIATDLNTATRRNPTDFYSSNFDVTITIRRNDEGTDWQVASHGYCVGIPKSFGLNIQRTGRGQRKKYSPHPFLDHTKMIYFIYSSIENEQLSMQHSRYVLAFAALIAEYSIADALCIATKLKDAFNVPKVTHRSVQLDKIDLLIEEIADLANTGLSKDVTIAIEKAKIVEVLAKLQSSGTVLDLISLADLGFNGTNPSDPGDVNGKLAVLALLQKHINQSRVAAVVDAHKQQIRNNQQIMPNFDPNSLLSNILDDLCGSFKYATIVEAIEDSTGAQCMAFSGHDSQYWAERIVTALKAENLDREKCVAGTKKYYENTGVPGSSSGQIPGYEEFTFEQLFTAINRGSYGTDIWGYNTWLDFLEDALSGVDLNAQHKHSHRATLSACAGDYDRTKVSKCILEAYPLSDRKSPVRNCKDIIPGYDGITTYMTLFGAIYKGFRGTGTWGFNGDYLAFLESLGYDCSKQRKTSRAAKNGANSEDYDRTKVSKCILRAYPLSGGIIPSMKCEDIIPGYDDITTYRVILKAIQKGNRGVGAWGFNGDYLAFLESLGYDCSKQRKYSNTAKRSANSGDHDLARVSKCILEAYPLSDGKVPGNACKDIIPGYDGTTYKALFFAIYHGNRGVGAWGFNGDYLAFLESLGYDCSRQRKQSDASKKSHTK